MIRKLIILAVTALVIAQTGCGGSSSTNPGISLLPSTIVFADGAAVSKQLGSGVYTNTVTGDGTGAIDYTS